MKKNLLIIFFLMCIAQSNYAPARSPAIEPVRGISIEEYKDVGAGNGKGFNFSSDTTTKTDQSRALANIENADTPGAGNIILIMLVALPLALFFGLMKGLKIQKKLIALKKESAPNKEETKNHSTDDDQNFPKAS